MFVSLPGQKEYFEAAAGKEALVGTVQDILDMYRDHDIAAEFRQREVRRREVTTEQTASPASEHLEADSGWFDAPRSRSAQLLQEAPGPSAGAAPAIFTDCIVPRLTKCEQLNSNEGMCM
jgi:hypothetical protein